jgi:hypothetical protein
MLLCSPFRHYKTILAHITNYFSLQMGQVAALQNQLALDVQSRMASIEKLLEEPGPNEVLKPDKEVEMWKARIQQLSGPGPSYSSKSYGQGNNAPSQRTGAPRRTQRDTVDSFRSRKMQEVHEREKRAVNNQMQRMRVSSSNASPQQHQNRSRGAAANTRAHSSAQPQRVSSMPVNSSGWYRAFDPKSGRPYLFNPETRETKWEQPKEKQNLRTSHPLTSQRKSTRPTRSMGTENQKPLSIKEALCLSCFDSASACKCDPLRKSKSSKLCNKCFDIPCQCK